MTNRIVPVCTEIVGLGDKKALGWRVQVAAISCAKRATDVLVQLCNSHVGKVVEVDLVAKRRKSGCD